MSEASRITIQVQPKSGRNKITRFEEGVVYIKIAAPPVKGKANQELIKYLSDILEVSKSSIIIEKGATGKRKLVSIQGLTQSEVSELFESQLIKSDKNAPKQGKLKLD